MTAGKTEKPTRCAHNIGCGRHGPRTGTDLLRQFTVGAHAVACCRPLRYRYLDGNEPLERRDGQVKREYGAGTAGRQRETAGRRHQTVERQDGAMERDSMNGRAAPTGTDNIGYSRARQIKEYW